MLATRIQAPTSTPQTPVGRAHGSAPVPINPVWGRMALAVQTKRAVGRETQQVAARPELGGNLSGEHPGQTGGRTAQIQAAVPPGASAQEGQPLEAGIRNPLERFFQHPLDRVRVFSDAESRHAAGSHNAYALTFGQDIHLGDMAQSLSVKEKKALFAHEVAHTIQQRDAPPATQPGALTPDAQTSPQERQADGLARAFMAHEGGHRAGLALRDRIGLHPAPAARVQLARVPTHYGEFEDFKFNEIKIVPAGTPIGVQLYLKFHPNNSVDATKIGLTQAADTVIAGTRRTDDLIARRSATAGAGLGYHIDVPENRPSPMYAASGNPKTGADAAKLASYEAPGVAAMTVTTVAGNTVSGIDYGGGSVYGYNYIANGSRVGPSPAALHDAPQDPTRSNDSQQLFETAALAMEGSMAGTYLGSVSWGWRRDGAGAFSSIPIALKSEGVPSANLLTAANIWNASKENIELVATAKPTEILDPNTSAVTFSVPQNTRMRHIATGTLNGHTFFQVEIVGGTAGRTGIVDSDDVKQQDSGRDTVDLPVPEIHTVTASGTVLSGEQLCSNSDPVLPAATRVMVVGAYSLPQYVRVQVANGPFTGRRGVIARSHLTREALGRR